MELSLAQELFLLAMKDEKGTLAVESDHLRIGMVGAMLLDLILQGRLIISEKKIHVVDASPHPDPFLEHTLSYLRKSKKDRTLKSWVSRLPDHMLKLVREVATSLVAAGILRHEKDKFLWVFPYHKFPTDDPTPELLIRQRIDHVVLGGAAPDSRTSVLVSLALACELTGELFEKDMRKQAKARMKEITKANEAGAIVVGNVIQETQAAIAVVIAASAASAAS